MSYTDTFKKIQNDLKSSLKECKVKVDNAFLNQMNKETELFLIKLYRKNYYHAPKIPQICDKLIPLIQDRNITEGKKVINNELQPALVHAFRYRLFAHRKEQITKALKAISNDFSQEVRLIKDDKDLVKLLGVLKKAQKEVE